MKVIYFNWKGGAGRETVDELKREDFAPDRAGAMAFRKEAARLCQEYALCGMAVYQSSRACSNWKGASA